MNFKQGFTLGMPNPGSSLFEPTIELLKRIGVSISYDGRSFEGGIEGMDIFSKVFLMRPQDIPSAIARGVINCGICGWDCVAESSLENQLVKIVELNYSKKSRKPAQIVVFSKRFKDLRDDKGITVTTEYPNITRKLFPNTPSENIDFSHGTTEAKVVAGMYDYGVCVTETGRSIKDNELTVVKVLLVSPTVFIAKEKIRELEGFGKMLAGALYGQSFKFVFMNADAEAKERIVPILPSLKSPTVLPLDNSEFSIATMVETSALANLLLQLELLGATGVVGIGTDFVMR